MVKIHLLFCIVIKVFPMEDLQRVLLGRGLSISTIEGKGRCLFTTRDFTPGEIILSEEPYVSVPSKMSEDLRCNLCFASRNLKRCSSCQLVWYCGSRCQKLDWKLHRLECEVLLKLDKNRLRSLTPSIRLMVKLYLRRKLQTEKVIPITAVDNYDLIVALVSHISDIDEKQLVLYAQMANLVSLVLQWPGLNIEEITKNFSKLACNAHTISDSELRPLGTGLYPVISIINHSCLANSVLVFEGQVAVVRAVQHIPEGSEVLISYIETAGSTLTRQKALKEQYFFTCTCPRCIKMDQHSDIRESAIMEGYRCKDNRCEGFLLREAGNIGFKCQQCGVVRDNEEIAMLITEIKLRSAKASNSIDSGYIQEACTEYMKVEELQMKLCHPFSINLMRTRELLLKILMELQNWKESLAYCRLTVPIYQRVYPGNHPLLGLQYYTSGKLEWLLGYTKEAVVSLTKAFDILRITHGTTSPFVEELQMKLEEARAECSYSSEDSHS